MKRLLLLPVIAAMCLALGACGSDSKQSADLATATSTSEVPASQWDSKIMPDPCRLITTADVEAALGRKTAAPSRQSSWPPGCDFPLDAGDKERVMVTENRNDTAKAEYDQLASQAESQPVDGLGAPAYYEPAFKTLHAFANKAHYTVVFEGAKPELQPFDQARLIMTKVVSVAAKEPTR